MFDVSIWEVLLIGVVALIVLGPKKLSQLALSLGKFMAKARQYMGLLKREMDALSKLDEEVKVDKETVDKEKKDGPR